MSKTAGGITIVGVGAALLLWKDIVPILEWLAPIAGRESVQHAATAWLIAAFTLPLPWVTPKRLAPFWTGSAAAAVAFLVAFGTYVTLAYPLTRTDVVYAAGIGGFGSISINLFLTAIYLHFRPLAIPESLKK